MRRPGKHYSRAMAHQNWQAERADRSPTPKRTQQQPAPASSSTRPGGSIGTHHKTQK